MKQKIIITLLLSLAVTSKSQPAPHFDPSKLNGWVNANLNTWIDDWASNIQVGIGSITIKSATSQYYFFDKYKAKFFKKGLNTLNEVNAGNKPQFTAGIFPAGEPFLESNLLTDPQTNNATLSSLQPNSTTVTFHADPAGNKARSIIIVAKNSISTDPAQKPIVIVNSISIDLDTLIGYIGKQFLYQAFPWNAKTMGIWGIGTKIIVLNITLDAVTADIMLDSFEMTYPHTMSFDPPLLDIWQVSSYTITQPFLNQNVIGITMLPNFDLSQPK